MQWILSRFTHVLLCDPLDCSHQAPLSMGFCRQEYWSRLLCPPPGGLPNLGIEPASLTSPALAGRFFTTSAIWEVPMYIIQHINTQPLTLVTVSPLLPMSDAKLSWTPGLWQSSHRFLLGSVPTYPCLSTPLSGPLTVAKSVKGVLAMLVSLWAVRHIAGLPRLREQFLTPSLPQNNRRSPGRDINVTGVWERNVTGRGVTVVVVDDGVEHTIQDIAPNYVSGPGVSPAPRPYLILDVASGLFPFPSDLSLGQRKGAGR